jgi:hypothetical protein
LAPPPRNVPKPGGSSLASCLLDHSHEVSIHRWLWLACAGCMVDGAPEPSAVSHVVTFSVPTPSVKPIDVLFVLDESPAMADEHARVVASMPGFAAAFEAELAGQDLNLGVIATDPSAGGHLTGGGFLHERSTVDAIERDFPGTLGDQLASLADQESGELEPNEPLDMSLLALDPITNPGFRRPGARLFLVIITNRDDESLGSARDYGPLTHDGGTRFYLTLVEHTPSARLDAFASDFAGLEDSYSAIGDTAQPRYDLQTSLFSLALLPPHRTPSGCLDATLATPHECTIEDIDTGIATAQISECDATAAKPCWRLGTSFGCTRVEIERAVFPAPNTWIHGQCAAESSSN